MKVDAFGLSDVGRCRVTNEDNFFYDTGIGLFAVADGMGGHAAGEVASQLAVDALVETIRDSDDDLADQGHVVARLKEAVREANRRIWASIETNEERRGMGTTLVALVTLNEHAIIGHVGDSRAYRLRDGRLEQLTADHSWVFEQVKAGLLSRDDAKNHPMRNIVTRALGSQTDVTVDLSEQEAVPGDLFLLCSDGLNAMLSDEEIQSMLQEHRDDPEAACHALVEAANERGGEDNTTVIVLRVLANGA